MMANSFESVNLVNELLESLKEIGVDGVTTLLQNARSKTLTLNDKNVEFVLKMVSNHYKRSMDELINTRSRDGKRRNAIGFCVYYLHNQFEYSFGQLQYVFKMDKSWLSRLNAMIKRDGKRKGSVNFEVKQKFDLIIKEYVK
jgi:chitinase